MSGLPYSYFVPITSKVQSPAFGVEKQHMLLAMVNDLIPTTHSGYELYGAAALTDFKKYFGTQIPEYKQLQKYFSFLSKTGTSPEKVVIARWYKETAKPFVKAEENPTSLSVLKGVSNGSFIISFDGEEKEIICDFSSATSYSEVAQIIQTSLDVYFSGATCCYSSITGGFIITSGESGKGKTCDKITSGSTGINLYPLLGFSNHVLSQGANAESYAEFCDRMYHANTSGFSITTLEPLSAEEIVEASEWIQLIYDGQTVNSKMRLVFNFKIKTEAKVISSYLEEKEYTGVVLTYDPLSEYINILDCAICASIDRNATDGAINFNFQPAKGYTPITDKDTVVDYQNGDTNTSLFSELEKYKISCVYSVGFGTNTVNYYGMGLMQGDFATEGAQSDESWLTQDIQVSVMNAFDTLNKFPNQGEKAQSITTAVIDPSFKRAQTAGVVAKGGTLSDTDKINIAQATGTTTAASSVEQNGYYFQLQELTSDDIEKKQARVITCYLRQGEVNKLRITNNIYGA
ncbi:MAG: DUF3383 family protein [Alphaproteobacteria bacterium]